MSRSIKYFQRFAWAVPLAFQAPIERCRFEEGDTIYDTKDAYLEWSEALKSLKWGIEVKFPKRSASEALTETDEDLCSRNWFSSITFELTHYQEVQRKEMFITTQGRLYSLLRTGNFDFLNEDTPHPPLPILPFEANRRLEEIENHTYIKELRSEMKKGHFFLMVIDPRNLVSCQKLTEVRACLGGFEVKEAIFSPFDLNLPNADQFAATVHYAIFAVDTGATEKLKDCFKKALYKPMKNVSAPKFHLRSHGLFIPFEKKPYADLVTISFSHNRGKFFYRFRLDNLRIKRTPAPLQEFMQSIVGGDCPNHLFSEEPRSSGLRIKLLEALICNQSHEITNLTKVGFSTYQQYKSNHEHLQVYLMNNDPTTVACEVPLWLDFTEYSDYKNLFPNGGTLTGHVDVLRFENDGKIWIWDFKPNAHKERYAAGQIYSYAIMLSCRTGIPLSEIRCGYFDANSAFIFTPALVNVDTTFVYMPRSRAVAGIPSAHKPADLAVENCSTATALSHNDR